MAQISELSPEARQWLTNRVAPLITEFVVTELPFAVPSEVPPEVPPAPPSWVEILTEKWPYLVLAGAGVLVLAMFIRKK